MITRNEAKINYFGFLKTLSPHSVPSMTGPTIIAFCLLYLCPLRSIKNHNIIHYTTLHKFSKMKENAIMSQKQIQTKPKEIPITTNMIRHIRLVGVIIYKCIVRYAVWIRMYYCSLFLKDHF